MKILAFWFHSTRSLTYSVGINAFWKNLNPTFYDPKDIYGNKDLLPATRALQSLDKAVKNLKELPEEYMDFYARRMIQILQEKCLIKQ